MEGLTLDNIAGGALAELFNRDLATVLANIADPNTSENAKRSIAITVTFKPKGRGQADVELTCVAKLAPVAKVDTQVYMGRVNGRLTAVENDPRQSSLFDPPAPVRAETGTGTVSAFPTEVRS